MPLIPKTQKTSLSLLKLSKRKSPNHRYTTEAVIKVSTKICASSDKSCFFLRICKWAQLGPVLQVLTHQKWDSPKVWPVLDIYNWAYNAKQTNSRLKKDLMQHWSNSNTYLPIQSVWVFWLVTIFLCSETLSVLSWVRWQVIFVNILFEEIVYAYGVIPSIIITHILSAQTGQVSSSISIKISHSVMCIRWIPCIVVTWNGFVFGRHMSITYMVHCTSRTKRNVKHVTYIHGAYKEVHYYDHSRSMC